MQNATFFYRMKNSFWIYLDKVNWNTTFTPNITDLIVDFYYKDGLRRAQYYLLNKQGIYDHRNVRNKVGGVFTKDLAADNRDHILKSIQDDRNWHHYKFELKPGSSVEIPTNIENWTEPLFPQHFDKQYNRTTDPPNQAPGAQVVQSIRDDLRSLITENDNKTKYLRTHQSNNSPENLITEVKAIHNLLSKLSNTLIGSVTEQSPSI